MADRESLVVFGVLLGLLGATIVPFAVPAMQLSRTPTPSPTPGEEKSAPAAVSPEPTVRPTQAPEAASPTSTPAAKQGSDPPEAAPQTLTSPELRCEPDTADGLPRDFPLTASGRKVTGEGVTVAVIDPSGFDLQDPRIAGQIGTTQSFRSGSAPDITNGGVNRHGTESAALVSRIAPDATLSLANFRKAVDFERAVEWAIENDVDVIVAPTTFYAKPNDGTAPVSQAVTKALDRGIPVVAPTGNVATHHWEGTYEGGPWLEFEPNDTRLYLKGRDRPVQLWLWWNETVDSGPNEFRIVLYKDLGDESRRIATSQDYPKGPVGANQVLFEKIRTNNLLSRSIGNGTYYIRIKGPNGTAHRVELVAAAHPLEAPVPEGSLMAPATATGDVIAVGAAQAGGDGVLATSSRGPTNDGRIGIDLIAPGTVAGPSGSTFTGTSAAAAYTGGIVTLMAAIDPSLTPARAEAVLQGTVGSDQLTEGILARGHGMIDPVAALECMSETGS